MISVSAHHPRCFPTPPGPGLERAVQLGGHSSAEYSIELVTSFKLHLQSPFIL